MWQDKKIALGYPIIDGPWGGGNQFLRSFKTFFEQKGAYVTTTLEDDLDFIIIINPKTGTFNHKDVKKYKKRNPNAKVIHRINETDKAKNTNYINKLRIKASKEADLIVFVSQWVRDYYYSQGFDRSLPSEVIHNGADESVFNNQGYQIWRPGEPMKIVTHHWSDNIMKGADIYSKFDQILDDQWMKDKFEFTYIGRLPKGVIFKNTKHVDVLSGNNLARELKKHHVYLTGARWESCGMHPLEGGCCGLPLLFIDEGGAGIECCKGFGIEFSTSDFEISLFKMLEQYRQIQSNMKNFLFNSEKMNNRYEEIMSNL